MNKYSYYTPVELADQLIQFLPKRKYKTIIDICCGTWNLLSSAKKSYPSAHIYGVDIDDSISNNKIEGASFVLGDGRKFAEQQKAEGKSYDLILSNPPFGNLKKQEAYWNAGNCEPSFSAFQGKRYELEMMLANIYLAHEKSVMLFILPITFIQGEMFKEARKQLAKSFLIHNIIELPINTFEKGKIKTAAIIIEKRENSRKKTNIRKAFLEDCSWKFEVIDQKIRKEIKQGNWINKADLLIPIDSIDIKRGSVHTGQMNTGENMVLHCSSNYENGSWIPSIRYTEQEEGVYAICGDILINRIGKGAGYWCVNTMENVQVSDCIFVLKNDREELVRKLRENTMDDGKLNIEMRGVTTMYITRSDICRMLKL